MNTRLIIYRTHSQTLALLREVQEKVGKSYKSLAVCHVHDQETVKHWIRQGAVLAYAVRDRTGKLDAQ